MPLAWQVHSVYDDTTYSLLSNLSNNSDHVYI